MGVVPLRRRRGELSGSGWEVARPHDLRLHPKDVRGAGARLAHLPGSPAPADGTAMSTTRQDLASAANSSACERNSITLGGPHAWVARGDRPLWHMPLEPAGPK